MQLKRVSATEVWFPSLPHVPSKSFINDKSVSRAEFMRVRSAAGETARHVLFKVPASLSL